MTSSSSFVPFVYFVVSLFRYSLSRRGVRAYVLDYREDIEALEVFFSRRTPDSEAIIYPSMFTKDGKPIEENRRIIEEAIAQKIQQQKNQS